jgi:hypothetical protein
MAETFEVKLRPEWVKIEDGAVVDSSVKFLARARWSLRERRTVAGAWGSAYRVKEIRQEKGVKVRNG